jgi:hypothetical protein
MTQTTRDASFGPVFVVSTFFSLSFRVYCRLQPICNIMLVRNKKIPKKERKNITMTQTTRLALFGPVFVVSTLLFFSCRVYRTVYVIEW